MVKTYLESNIDAWEAIVEGHQRDVRVALPGADERRCLGRLRRAQDVSYALRHYRDNYLFIYDTPEVK